MPSKYAVAVHDMLSSRLALLVCVPVRHPSHWHTQNVLMQMGLRVLSIDGMLIRKAKTFVLKCSACLEYACTHD